MTHSAVPPSGTVQAPGPAAAAAVAGAAAIPASGHGDGHHGTHSEAHGPVPTGWRRWLNATSHKDIGTLYLLFSFAMFMVGGVFAMLIRLELLQPGLQILNPETYNQLVTMHGLVMVFGAIMPAFVGFANWMIPLQIGASDMAFARMNNFSFWLLFFAGLLLLGSFFTTGGAVAAGWTLYAPLTLQMGPGMDMAIFAIHLMGASSIMGAINIIVTILNMRAPGMTLMKMPLFCWSWLITAYLLIAVMPVLAGAITMTLTDRHFGTTFFNASGGGDPVLYQHIFWFFGHPEVYIMILPAFGIVSHVIPTFARKKLFGYSSMVYALAAIAILSFIVWAHHMFATGMPVTGQLFFMYATMLVAVPTAVKVFNWTATMWRGSMTFETPMLFAVGFIFVFSIGGLSGVMLSIAPLDLQYHDTYFVVAHFHYVLVAGSLFAMFAGYYYWVPKWTGVMYSERRGQWHFWTSIVSLNVTFFPMHFLGLAGMPRRYVDYAAQFTDFHALTSVAAIVFGFSQVYFLFAVLLPALRHRGAPAGARPWEGAEGLEWEVPSPAPMHTFVTPPRLDASATRVVA
ncbi:cytochrome c oxidase subunit I [Paracidovorax citrulli]|uniref:Cytochrome c oxidase subunit 1 n=2 Tax=Paracidovorax citrulli TaxID=80869 RepID=A1TT20_PARC0|nr:cytochrome c oxidase subunit I [Paracidovorax citrulli]ABM34108.1 Cytochrome-c oxidase [Paracidovorax citrulli AAC00-1]ATG93620.1 cytochrome c oxidase subunit I [Paracidovorax citrulli]MVT27799.1 cytochrome c oxidase subunit I [Paracidovorax citrulli]PVY63546.1 cytochrome c oxidase subunit 1 [Paracidovorax citrulli]QCX09542.1 Cytochrome c oxidase subunit 1 [Paracidovorax citrulli]